jgi:hypothetical protein
MTAQELLDEVVRLAQLEAFAAETYTTRLAEELGPADGATVDGLEARDARLRAALDAIDGFASKSMRIRLDHLDAAIPSTFRTYLASMVTSYEHDRDTLRERVAAVVARTDPDRAAALAESVTEAAGKVLAARSQLRDGVLALRRDLAARSFPAAHRAARDPTASDEERRRWTAIADRLKTLAGIEETPEDEVPAQPSREELIELD